MLGVPVLARSLPRLLGGLSRNPLAVTRMVSTTRKPLPSVETFTTCTDYLTSILSESGRVVQTQDWDEMLQEITNTLPTGTLFQEDGPNFAEHASVNEHSRVIFALKICYDLKQLDAAIALLTGSLADLRWREKAFFCQVVCSTAGDATSCFTDEQEDVIFKVCDDLLANESMEAMPSMIGALATTSKWKDAFDVWERFKGSQKLAIGPRQLKHLAFAALANGDMEKFWMVLDHESFHQGFLYLRERGTSGYTDWRQVFLKYVNHCENSLGSSGSTADNVFGMEDMFRYLGRITHCADDVMVRQLLRFFEHSLPHHHSSSTENKSPFQVALHKFGPKGSRCGACGHVGQNWQIGPEDADKLNKAIYEKIIMEFDDVHASTNPKELQEFQSSLANLDYDYDIVVDGLNIALLRLRQVSFKDQKLQSITLLAVLRKLNEMGMKPLVIHQKRLLRYPHIISISGLCKFILLDKLSKDDPFFMMAALNTNRPSRASKKVLLLTNDSLAQHNAALQDSELRRLFTYWQSYHQAKAHFIEDVEGGIAYVRIPKPRLIAPSKTAKGSWHVPLKIMDEEDSFLKMRLPSQYMCIREALPSRAARSDRSRWNHSSMLA